MAESVLDFAGLDAAAAAVETPVVDSGASVDVQVDSGTDVSVDNSKATEGTQDTKDAAIVDNKSAVETKDASVVEDDLPGTEKTPQEIRKALKAFKDADPKNAAMVKQLHGSYERHEAYKVEFPTVEAAREAKAFIESVGGPEGYQNLQNIVQSVNESDELLYAGDGKLIDNIYEDMKTEGKSESFGKLATPFLDKLQEVDPKTFYKTLTPHYVASLEKSQFPQVLNALISLVSKGDEASIAQAKDILTGEGGMQEWWNSLKGEVTKAKADAVNPERQALAKEREKFQQEQLEYKTNQTKEYQQAVGKEVASTSNKLMGSALGPFLKMPYFKAFKMDNLRPLANTITGNLLNELESDKAYQTQMKALWGAKNPDKAKILQYHKTKVESISARIVRDTVQKMYPDHAKGGSAAGRVAAAEQKKNVQIKTDAVNVASGKPVYVAVKPGRDQIDYSKDPNQLLEIAGKAFLKNGKYVTWRKPLA